MKSEKQHMEYLTELDQTVIMNEYIQVLTTVNDEKKAVEIARSPNAQRKLKSEAVVKSS